MGAGQCWTSYSEMVISCLLLITHYKSNKFTLIISLCAVVCLYVCLFVCLLWKFAFIVFILCIVSVHAFIVYCKAL